MHYFGATMVTESFRFHHFENCIRLFNSEVELVVATEIGPRILSYRKTNGKNLFDFIPHVEIETELGRWKPWGGHRLWAAPEKEPDSYHPDNTPVEYRILDENQIEIVGSVESTGLQKRMRIELV